MVIFSPTYRFGLDLHILQIIPKNFDQVIFDALKSCFFGYGVWREGLIGCYVMEGGNSDGGWRRGTARNDGPLREG